jgi:hypothetical protein
MPCNVMIKFFGLIPRRAATPRQRFHDYWRHPHGALGVQNPAYRGYVQSHQIDCDALAEEQRRFEGVAEVWLDSRTDARRKADDPWYLEHARPDEDQFVDGTNLCWLYTTESVLSSRPHGVDLAHPTLRFLERYYIERPTTVKLIQLIAPNDFRDEDNEIHQELGAMRHVLCTVQRDLHGDTEPPFGWVRELWWPTLSAFEDTALASAAFSRSIARSANTVTLLAQAERFA